MREISIQGARVYFYIFNIPITSTIINMWMIMLLVMIICLILTSNLRTKNISKKQIIAEIIVSMLKKLTIGNMGEKYSSMAPFVASVFILSALCSISSILGFYPPTSDLSVTLGWSLLVFIMITYTKIKTNNFGGYLKSFTKPIAILTPFNLISEISTPVSMAFRHFGNIASGGVILTLLHAALAALSRFLLGWLPAPIKNIPIFEVGIPAFASIYFDLFSGFLQAYIFCMLMTMYIREASEK